MKVKCMLVNRKFSKKPTGKNEVGSLQNRLCETEIELVELADGLSNGMSFRPGDLVGGRSKLNWMEQQLFGLDFDDGMTPDEAIEISKQYNISPVKIQ